MAATPVRRFDFPREENYSKGMLIHLKSAVARGGQPWQDFLLFETVVLRVGGPDVHRKAFVAPNTAPVASARDWIWASQKLAKGEAGMQLMGDWA